MASQPDVAPADQGPPPWLLPVLVLVLVGAAVGIAVVLTRPPASPATLPAAQDVAPAVQGTAPAAGAVADDALPHGAIDPHGPPIERIELAAARTRFDSRTALFVDVRPGSEFAAGHIAGAVSLASAELETRMNSLAPGTAVIAYSDAARPEAAVRAAQIFIDLGYPTVIALEGGWQGWQNAGYPVEMGTPSP